jgi:hypothetical protein
MSDTVNVRLPRELARRIDEAAQGVPRERWVRMVLSAALEPEGHAIVYRDPKPQERRPLPTIKPDPRPSAPESIPGGSKGKKMIFKCPRPACTRSHLGPAVCSNHGVDMVATGQEI